MAGITMRTDFLIELMLAGVGQRGADDLKYHWFETIYSIIREQPWPWNWDWTRGVTYASITTTETFTWAQGAVTLITGGAMTLTYQETGRMFVIDGRPYKVIKVDTNTITVDAPLHIASTAPTLLTFYRSNYSVKTPSLREVMIDSYRIESTSRNFWRKEGGHRQIQYDGAKPRLYMVDESTKIDPPLYAPINNGAAGGGSNIGIGTYEYFFTYYDVESGLESAPGPTFQRTYAPSSSQSMGYDNPTTANEAEIGSYTMRLYRSKVSPTGTRYTAWLIGSKAPLDATSFVADTNSDKMLIGKQRHYAGNTTLLVWHQWPDAIYSIDIECMKGWSARPDPMDMIEVGRNNIVTELLALGASVFVELQNRGIESQMTAIIKFRRQLGYLTKKTDKANADDPGREEITRHDGTPDGDQPYTPIPSYQWNN
jgi:hypothetical protein